MKNNDTDATKILECCRQYMAFVVQQPPTRKQFVANMEAKLKDNEFITDMYAIIRPGISYSVEEAWAYVRETLVEHI